VIHPKTLLISRHFYSLESYVWRSIYNLKIDTISTYDIPLDRSFLKLWNSVRHVMPSTYRRVELKEKTSMAQTVWQSVVYAKGIMKSRSTYYLKIDTISTYDIPLDRSFLKLWNSIRHVMPSTDRRLELKEKTSMAQNAWQAFVYASGLILKCFYNCTFFNDVCISWTIKCWICLCFFTEITVMPIRQSHRCHQFVMPIRPKTWLPSKFLW